jgi:single-strand DNA-binding protein
MANRSVNKVILLGNLTRDPELKYTPSGVPICTFGVATNRSWTTAEGQTKEETQYHRITAWNKVAELCGKLLTKGKKVYLEGRITYRNYTGKDGTARSITEIVLDDFIVFGDGAGVKRDMMSPAGETEHHEHMDIPEIPTDEKVTESPKEDKTHNDETINPDDIPF